MAEVKKGTDFAELAKQKSKDPGAAAEGGDLGYFGKEQMVPEFAEAAFKMEKGQVSDPVKTQFGWHIIKVEDKRTKPVPEFDKVKDQIETYVSARRRPTTFTSSRKPPRSSGWIRSSAPRRTSQSINVMAGLVPAIHVLLSHATLKEVRRGCPAQGRA